MAKDHRDLLEVLENELDFIDKGGYSRSVRTPWLTKSIFQDSSTCLNYGYPYRAHPCNECHLFDFVAPKDRSQAVPCHYIPLNADGDTIEELESTGDESNMQYLVKEWLHRRIVEIKAERAAKFWQSVD